MSKDILFLLPAGFKNEKYPDRAFMCPQGIAVEGALALYPEIRDQLDIRRVDFPRPRQEVIAYAGEENQGLPLLILGEGRHSEHSSGKQGEHEFVSGRDKIIAALAELYGIAELHP